MRLQKERDSNNNNNNKNTREAVTSTIITSL